MRPHPIADGADFASGALERLRGCPEGAVLLAASDEGIELLLEHRAGLAARFRLDLCHPEAQRRMLDKLLTYEAAREAGPGLIAEDLTEVLPAVFRRLYDEFGIDY